MASQEVATITPMKGTVRSPTLALMRLSVERVAILISMVLAVQVPVLLLT